VGRFGWRRWSDRAARGVLFEPRATFKEVDSEFTKQRGLIWGRYNPAASRCSDPLAGAIGRLVFGKRIAGMSLPESVSITGAITWFGISLVLQLAAVFALTQIISLLAPVGSVDRRTTSRR